MAADEEYTSFAQVRLRSVQYNQWYGFAKSLFDASAPMAFSTTDKDRYGGLCIEM